MNSDTALEPRKIPSWLQHLRDNSWEAEILISGGAIFSLFQLLSWLTSYVPHLKEIIAFHGFNKIYMTLAVIMCGVGIGFVLHLFVRAFWIGLVCLDKVYPDGINFTRLPLSRTYRTAAEKINLMKQIEVLDDLARMIFVSTFLVILIFTGALITILILGNLTDALAIPTLGLVFTALALIYLLDLFLGGILRRNRAIGKIYYPVYLVFNVLTLGVIWRPYIQVIFTNVNRLIAGTALIIFVLLSITLGITAVSGSLQIINPFDLRSLPAQLDPKPAADDQYLDRVEPERTVRWACIQSDFIKDDFVRVFIPYRATYIEFIEATHKKSFEQIVTLSLNGKVVENVDMIDYVRRPINQYGLVAYIPILDLPKGKNLLGVKIAMVTFYYERDELIIPFWKE